MQDKFKNLGWIVLGGYAIGIFIRRAWDSIRGIPAFLDAPLIDIDSVLYGASFIFMCIWLALTVIAIVEHRPWKEAKDFWNKFHPEEIGNYNVPWLLCRSLITVLTYLSIYFFVAYFFCFALCGGDYRDGNIMFLFWCLAVFLNWLYYVGLQKKWFATEPDTLERSAVKILDLPVENGKFIIMTIVISFLLGIQQYPKVSQSFGGGRPGKVIVFLKQGTSISLPSQASIEGKVIDLVFRRGSKMGFKADNSSDSNMVVIDQDKIDRLYVGNKISELDTGKLK